MSKVSEKMLMETVQVFTKWLESIDAVAPDLYVKVRSPTLWGEENIRDVMLDSEQVGNVLTYLRKYEYASNPQVTIELMWHTMMRIGSVHTLGCSDYYPVDQSVEVVNRPESGTPIKNGRQGDGTLRSLTALLNPERT